ncbi:hypothetical protein BH09MYX1_BH09MYX1_33230 [soil metagenome]
MLSSRRLSAVVATLVALTGTSAVLFACAGLLGIDDLTNAPDAASDASDAATETGPTVCVPSHVVDRSDAADDDAGADYILGIDSLALGLEQSAQTDISWDLDNHCTCEDKVTPEACIRPTPSAAETCDGKDGRDLAGNLALRQATSLVAGVSDTNLAAQLENGKFGAVIVVRGYNGTANDPKVRVDFAPSYGTILTDDAGTPIKTGNGSLQNAVLKHDGTDRWGWAPTFATASGNALDSLAFDEGAYVRDGMMVAHFPVVFVAVQFALTNGNPLVFRVVEVVVSAKIDTTAGGLTLTGGRVGGRVHIGDMLRSFFVWTDPTGGDLCEGSVAYTAIQGGLCRNRDIRSLTADDHKNLPCDAISFGLGFSAEPGLLYGEVGFNYKKTSCFDGTVPTTPSTSEPCK